MPYSDCMKFIPLDGHEMRRARTELKQIESTYKRCRYPPRHNYENWQYICTHTIDGIWHHHFRHYYHPTTGRRETVDIKESP